MTITTPTTTAPSGTTSSFRTAGTTTRRRRWIAVSAGALALAGASVAVVAFDGSDTDRPAVESVVPAVDAVDAGVAVRGPVSADAAERHAANAAASSCSGLSADAAEGCMNAGR